jgi:hypothetical protein
VAGAPTVIGQRYDCAFAPFDGGIDDTAIYNYALSAEQVMNHYVNGVNLHVAQSGNNVVVTWPGPGVGVVLQSSPDLVSAHFTPVAGATSPHTEAVGAAPKYFRLAFP